MSGPGESGAQLPDPATFTSGEHGTVAGKRGALRRLGDRKLDAWLAMSGARRAMHELADKTPRREVLVASVYAEKSNLVGPAIDEMRASRHNVHMECASIAELGGGGKFENLNKLLERRQGPVDWTIVIDDDVTLPRNFLDSFIAMAEAFDFQLVQPAQTLASHAAWRQARRVPESVARQTNFVEIGPVTGFSRAAAAELLPFPPLTMGWGLDLHWGAVAEQRGWKLGVIDALPVRHETRVVGGAYSSADAIEEAQRFLATHPYIDASEAGRTLELHRSVPQ